MNEINSVVFLRSYKESFKYLPLEQQAIMYNIIFDYALDGIEPTLDESDPYSCVRMALFTTIKPNIDASNNRYMNCKANGKKGGRPSKNQNQEETNEETSQKPNNNQEETKEKPNNNQEETKEKPKANPTKTLDKDKDKDKDMDKDMDMDKEDISYILQDTSIEHSDFKHVHLSPTQFQSLVSNIPGIKTYIKQLDDFLDTHPKQQELITDHYQAVKDYYYRQANKPITVDGIPI